MRENNVWTALCAQQSIFVAIALRFTLSVDQGSLNIHADPLQINPSLLIAG